MTLKHLKVKVVLNATFFVIFEGNVGTEGGIRTHTPLREPDFESRKVYFNQGQYYTHHACYKALKSLMSFLDLP